MNANDRSGRTGLLRPVFRAVREWIRNLVILFTPSGEAVRGAVLGIAVTAVLLLLLTSLPQLPTLGVPVALLQILYFLGKPLAFTLLFALALAILTRITPWYRWMMIAGFFFISGLFMVPAKAKVLLYLWFLVFSSLTGAVVWLFIRKRWILLVRPKRILTLVSLVLGLSGLGAGLYLMLDHGQKKEMPVYAAMKAAILPPTLGLPDPSLPGMHTVLRLSYGSGKDRHRPEYGEEAVLITDSVDGRPFIGNWAKFHGWAREKYWGFGPSALPLNGRVWYPEGSGPFPLVLVVHGNHLDRDYSDPGYAYLGELLASRGFILVSVDMNFLNAAWYNVFDRLKEENDARAWLLLKHLECWEKWNREAGNPFRGRVDMERIALIGHSRGGEAVNIAACFNRLPYYPDDAILPFSFGFNIRSVIPIAPVDGQYRPADAPTSYENVNYFVLHGSHDMDMRSYHGARQFHRVHFTDTLMHVKAGLYVYGANHGQFNTRWGRNDVGYPGIYLFNRKDIMPAEDQEKIARTYISAFLEMTLLDRWDYLPLFYDSRTGRDWLPETIYLNQYEDSHMRWICSYEEDIDLTTASMDSVEITAENLTVWKERAVPLRWGLQDTRGAYLGWNRKDADSLTGSYSISLPDSLFSPEDALVFSLADAGESPDPERAWLTADKPETGTDSLDNAGEPANSLEVQKKKVNEQEQEEEDSEPMDFTIELTDRAGNSASLPLSHRAALQPQLKPPLMKWDLFTKEAKSEIIFQSYRFPIKEFTEQNPDLVISGPLHIRFVFDRSTQGVVVLDNLGVQVGTRKQ